jgi:hypothetical protein
MERGRVRNDHLQREFVVRRRIRENQAGPNFRRHPEDVIEKFPPFMLGQLRDLLNDFRLGHHARLSRRSRERNYPLSRLRGTDTNRRGYGQRHLSSFGTRAYLRSVAKRHPPAPDDPMARLMGDRESDPFDTIPWPRCI